VCVYVRAPARARVYVAYSILDWHVLNIPSGWACIIILTVKDHQRFTYDFIAV